MSLSVGKLCCRKAVSKLSVSCLALLSPLPHPVAARLCAACARSSPAAAERLNSAGLVCAQAHCCALLLAEIVASISAALNGMLLSCVTDESSVVRFCQCCWTTGAVWLYPSSAPPPRSAPHCRVASRSSPRRSNIILCRELARTSRPQLPSQVRSLTLLAAACCSCLRTA